MRNTSLPLIACLIGAACASVPARINTQPHARVSNDVSPESRNEPIDVACDGCASGQIGADVQQALVARIEGLRQRGGACAAYADVIDRAQSSQLITVKPYMWRVGRSLTSGEARPNGEMTLARDIDSLNVGVRTLSELVWSIEHEAVHIAFTIPSGSETNESRVDGVVRSCRA